MYIVQAGFRGVDGEAPVRRHDDGESVDDDSRRRLMDKLGMQEKLAETSRPSRLQTS